MRKGDWYRITVCPKCQNRLSNRIHLYSDGICPKCGRDSNGTICETNNIIIRKIKHHPWWRFWDKKFTYEGRNELSKNWLKNNK